MEVTFLHVAEYANVTRDDKLNVMGIFGNISAANFPAIHPEMYLVAQLTANPSEYGRAFKLFIKLLDEDATTEVISFKSDMVVPRSDKGSVANMNITLRLINTTFEKPGTYEFSVLVDEDHKRSLPLEVFQVQPQG